MYVDEGFRAGDMRCQYASQLASLEAQAYYAVHRTSQTRYLPSRASARVREAGSCLVNGSNGFYSPATAPQNSEANSWGTPCVTM